MESGDMSQIATKHKGTTPAAIAQRTANAATYARKFRPQDGSMT